MQSQKKAIPVVSWFGVVCTDANCILSAAPHIFLSNYNLMKYVSHSRSMTVEKMFHCLLNGQ